MIEVGEASGALAAMLTSVAEFYEEEVCDAPATHAVWIPIVNFARHGRRGGFILISLSICRCSPFR